MMMDRRHFEEAFSMCFLKITDLQNDGDDLCDVCKYDLSTGLGVGATVAIVIAAVVVVGVGGFCVFWFVIKKKSFADLKAVFKKK